MDTGTNPGTKQTGCVYKFEPSKLELEATKRQLQREDHQDEDHQDEDHQDEDPSGQQKRAKFDGDDLVTIEIPARSSAAFREQDYHTFTSHLPGLNKYAETSCDGDIGRAMRRMDIDADMIPFVLATVKNGEPPEEPYTNRKIISSVLSKCGISHELRDILQSHGFPGSEIIP